MDTEFNYLYEDKYYENAVKNLKSTFFDVVEREEIMLNNLENRISQETDEGVKASLLDLWSKQNDSLDQSLQIFRQLKQSVRVIDSFVKELSKIDEAIVSDIINSTNYIRSTRIQEMMQQDEMEQQPVIQEEQIIEEQPQEIVNENIQEEVIEEPVIETSTEEKVEEPVVENEPALEEQAPEIIEEKEDTSEEPTNENIQEEIIEEPVVEMSADEKVEEPVVENEPVLEEQAPEIIEEKEETSDEPTIENIQEEVIEEPVIETSTEEKVEESVNENESAIEENKEAEVSEKPSKENDNAEQDTEEVTELPPIEEEQNINSDETNESTKEESSKEENTKEDENQPLIPLKEEEVAEEEKEETTPLIPINEDENLSDLKNIEIETNDAEEDKNQLLENVELPVDSIETEDIKFDENFNMTEVPEMEVVNEENDGMDLPNIVEADKIDFSSIEQEDPEEKINTEKNDEVVELPNTDKNEDTNKQEDKYNKESFAKPKYVAKEDGESAKAIIVNDGQFEKLNESLEKQENKLFTRGYLTSELINNTNYIFSKSLESKNNDEIDQMINEEEEIPTREAMEGMIEQAAELYKSGKKREAQALYEKISSLNDRIHEKEGPELVKTA